MEYLNCKRVNESLNEFLESPRVCVADQIAGKMVVKRVMVPHALVSNVYSFNLINKKSLVYNKLKNIDLPLFYHNNQLLFQEGVELRDLKCDLMKVLEGDDYLYLVNFSNL